MAERIPIRLTRPYSSVEAFIQAEGWSIGKNGVVLIGHPPLAAETEVRCEVVLTSGEPIVRAEGTVVRLLPAQGGRPSGLQIRFQRMTPATKAFLKRVTEMRGGPPGEPRDASQPGNAVPPPPAPRPRSAPTSLKPTPRSSPVWARPSASRSLDALRIRAGQSIPPPANRDELLHRLRARARSGSGRG
jgi:hypothetical protein